MLLKQNKILQLSRVLIFLSMHGERVEWHLVTYRLEYLADSLHQTDTTKRVFLA